MNAVFADTFYFIALLNADDEAHAAADQFAGDESLRLVTSAWVLTELADGLPKPTAARYFATFWPILKQTHGWNSSFQRRGSGAAGSTFTPIDLTRNGP